MSESLSYISIRKQTVLSLIEQIEKDGIWGNGHRVTQFVRTFLGLGR
jgi:hypothetical protein